MLNIPQKCKNVKEKSKSKSSDKVEIHLKE
jgi:hypothetical protein